MKVEIIGNVELVLEGKVAPDNLYRVDPKQLPYALGGAGCTNEVPLKIGEAMIFAKTGHVFIPPHSYVEKGCFYTPFLMGINTRPKEELLLKTPSSIEAIYEEMLKKYREGFAVVGEVFFEKLEVAYLKNAPIHHQNINTFKEKYWAEEIHLQIVGYIFGIALPFLDTRAFYQNPNEANRPSFYSHTHVLLKEKGARHLLTQSFVRNGNLWIESVTNIEKLF